MPSNIRLLSLLYITGITCLGVSHTSFADRWLFDLRYNIQHDSNADGWRTDVDTHTVSGKLSQIQTINSRSRLSNSLTVDYADQSRQNEASYWQWQAKTTYSYKLGQAFQMPILSVDGFTQHRHYTNREYHNSQRHGVGIRLLSHLNDRISVQTGYHHQSVNNAYPTTLESRWDTDSYHGYQGHIGINFTRDNTHWRYRYYDSLQTAFVSRATTEPPVRQLIAWEDAKVTTHEYGVHWPIAKLTAIDLRFQQYRTHFKQLSYVNHSTSLMLLHRFAL